MHTELQDALKNATRPKHKQEKMAFHGVIVHDKAETECESSYKSRFVDMTANLVHRIHKPSSVGFREHVDKNSFSSSSNTFYSNCR